MKGKEEIYQSLCDSFESRSGTTLADGSEIAVRLWATAAALESLYYYADWCKQQSFPQTATGKYLDYHGQMRDLTRADATRATGTITFYLAAAKSTATEIPVGTVAATRDQVLFETTEVGSIPAGDVSAPVPAACQCAGRAGNVAARTITYLTQAPAGVIGCVNDAAFQGGADGEGDEPFRQRILQSYRRLSTGGNSDYYYQLVMENREVASCKVVPREGGKGSVGVYITGVDTNTETLRMAVEKQLNEEREITTDVTVAFAPRKMFSLEIQLWPAEGISYTLAAGLVRTAVNNYMRTVQIGQNVYLSQVGHAIMNTGLVEHYAFAEGAADITVLETQQAYLQTLTLQEGT